MNATQTDIDKAITICTQAKIQIAQKNLEILQSGCARSEQSFIQLKNLQIVINFLNNSPFDYVTQECITTTDIWNVIQLGYNNCNIC